METTKFEFSEELIEEVFDKVESLIEDGVDIDCDGEWHQRYFDEYEAKCMDGVMLNITYNARYARYCNIPSHYDSWYGWQPAEEGGTIEAEIDSIDVFFWNEELDDWCEAEKTNLNEYKEKLKEKIYYEF